MERRIAAAVALVVAACAEPGAAGGRASGAGSLPLAAAGSVPSKSGAPPPTPPAVSTTASRIPVRGMDAAQVRALLGEPSRVEKVGSAALPGAHYERWIYPGEREITLFGGKVIDVWP